MVRLVSPTLYVACGAAIPTCVMIVLTSHIRLPFTRTVYHHARQ